MKLGTRVKWTAVLQRDENEQGEIEWMPIAGSGEGVLIGYRDLPKGTVINDSDFDEWSGRTSSIRTWVTSGTTPAALVAYHMRRKPIYVPRSALVEL